MSCPSIEFFVHPPSPPLKQCTLPSVSQLPSEPYMQSNRLPHLQSIIPQTNNLRPVEPSPQLSLSISFDQISLSSCSSPSSPNPIGAFDTPISSPASSPTHSSSKEDLNRPFLLPPVHPSFFSRRLSDSSIGSNYPSSFSVSSVFSCGSSPHSSYLSSPDCLSTDTGTEHGGEDMPSPTHSSDSSELYSSTLHPQDTEKLSDMFSTPVKRKRGRPPNASRRLSAQAFTFVTPTVWEVRKGEPRPWQNSKEAIVVDWSRPLADTEDRNLQQEEASNTSTSLNTFTNINMDTTLSMPKKKRGRKPKMQMEGNSCFVWRDLTARRGANKNARQRHPVLGAAFSPETTDTATADTQETEH
ncbi:hypothetical protein BDF14DRAFT_1830226 [Spinellus fusiger]|nr:hypothetical protein BDF14DRAFT_1830226 [Spinellus fusiger]